jgi:hypothetical protein
MRVAYVQCCVLCFVLRALVLRCFLYIAVGPYFNTKWQTASRPALFEMLALTKKESPVLRGRAILYFLPFRLLSVYAFAICNTILPSP